ncbi:MAG: NAD(P)H-hydrate dehydratase [Clostridiales bacterium]|nr:NAD(P)H-hydrate dehydratase [Clostridiales bacterium]
MEYVLSAEEMKACDSRTIELHRMSQLVLMERAAFELASEVCRKGNKSAKILVLAGCGNNGGDGLAAGRILWQAGYDVTWYLAGEKEKCSAACRRQMEILDSYGLTINTDSEETDILTENEYDIIIDALFGVGLSRNISDRLAEIVAIVNLKNAYVIACDIPSGICADTGKVMGCAIRANLTVTFAWKKRGLLLYPGAEFAGKIHCVQMGITEQSFEEGKVPETFTYGKEDLCRLPERKPDGNKGSFGKILLLAGSTDMAGAAYFCGKSCYRIGAGMVRVYTPKENRTILQTLLPEAVLHTYRGTETKEEGEMLQSAERERLMEDIRWADCIVAGPGIGTDETAKELISVLLNCEDFCGKACVLDADALNLIAGNIAFQQLLKEKAGENRLILTPHLAEFSRLTGKQVIILKEDIIKYTKEFAEKYRVTLVCKDACTVVAKKGKAIYLNSSGNDALATAGTGDVLSGMIGGLAAYGMDDFEAACLGVYIHGLAGEEAAARDNRYSVMAGELPDVLCRVLHTENG